MAANSTDLVENLTHTMVVLITCKNEEDPIKNEGTKELKRLYVDFSDTQGNLAKSLSHPSFNGYPNYLQE